MCPRMLCWYWWLSSTIARCMRVISSHEMPFLYAFTYGGYAFAVSRPFARDVLTSAARRHARSSAAVIGRLSLSVPGFGIGILDILWAGCGIVRIANDSVTTSDTAVNHASGSLAKMLMVNCLCLLLVGMDRIDFRSFRM